MKENGLCLTQICKISSTEEITMTPALDEPLSPAAADLMAVMTESSFSELIIASILFLRDTPCPSFPCALSEEGDDRLVVSSLISNGSEDDSALFLFSLLSFLESLVVMMVFSLP